MERIVNAGWFVRNKLTISFSVFFLLVCVFAVGCDTTCKYNLTVPNPKDFPFSRGVNDVNVYIKPWTDSEVVKKQFSADLLKENILPIQIIIENRSPDTVRFSSTQAELDFSRGQTQRALSEGEMGRRTEQNMTAPLLINALPFGAPVAAIVGSDIERQNLQARQTRQENTMSSVIIDSQKVMCGFLFFQSPVDVKTGFTANFVIRRLPRDSGGYLIFNIPLSIEKK
jgi:hypothetical protein